MRSVKDIAQIAVAVVLACVFNSLVNAQGPKAAGDSRWPQVFADDFNRSDVFGPDWEVKTGKWDVRGNLKANGPGAVMMCARRFETPFRIEYECYSDNPCDLSIELRKKLEDKAAVCFVGFGGENNTLNKISVPIDGDVARSRDKLIEMGRRHKVAVEVGEDGTVKQAIDGQETLKATVKTLPKKLYFGFYVWNQGVFNGVKVFSPHTGTEEAAPAKKAEKTGEKIPMVRQFMSFDACAVGAITDANIKAESGEKCAVKITDAPTWLYCFRKYSDGKYRTYDENEDPGIPEPDPKTVTNHGARFVSDPCVELMDEGAAGKHAAVTFKVPEMRKGLIEFDLMGDYWEGDGIKIKLGGRAALWINRDGDYYWQAGTNTIKLLDHCQLMPSMGPTRFYLPPQKWFTVRIDFDLEMSLANVGIVKMFNAGDPDRRPLQAEYIAVGEDLPLPADAVKEIRFETCGKGRFLVDNLFMISRTEDLADDARWRKAGREIMTAYYPLRKDPIHLKNWSMRNIRCMWGSGHPTGDELYGGDLRKERCGVILECAEKYNAVMVKQAFLGEKMRGLERAWNYAEKAANDYHGKVEAARQATAKTEALLGELYEFYAACYLDRLNQDKMKEGFAPRIDALNAAIETADAAIQKTLEEMRAEVVKWSGGKFTPYEIESEDTTSVKAKFSDGAFRRPDGKKDFLFVKMFYWLWPAMEKVLRFSPISPLAVTHHDLVSGAPEPEYCAATTNTWFYKCLTRRPDEEVALRIYYGEHNHNSCLPMWWFEKHKNDPDILLQNSRGEVNPIGEGHHKAYNYWNADVLAAQKAVLESVGDLVVKYSDASRVSYIDMAQEAYFLVTGPGGVWETGYNPSAVKAFRERLGKKYGSIGALNERWGSKYGSFEEIQPPEDWRLKPERVPGLTCEFERFRQESWHEWLKQCHVWLKDKLPGKVPNSCQITYNGQTCVDGLDWVKLFETFNIVMEHYFLRFESDAAVHRYLENLREVFKSTTGIGEWYVSADDIFDEQAIRNNGLRQAYQQVQWGRSVLVYWQAHDFMFLHNGNATENRLGHTVLRYSAAYIPISIARAEAHRTIYLECPLVQADVGILESESSYYNVCDVRGGGYEFASLLFSKGHDYGNLFERLVLDGRQKLDDYKVIVMPNAACLPDKFVDKLLAWVKAGGILLTTGAAGVMNEYGVKGGKLPDEVLGAGQWTYEKGKLSVKEGVPGLEVLAQDSSKQPALVVKDCGKGKVYMRLNPVKEGTVYEIISRYAPRKFYGKDNRFHLVMREGKKGERYLSVLNPDCYRQLDDEIVLEGEYRDIADISCNFPIKPEIRDGKTSFKLSLAPVEGIMIRIQK